MVRGFEIYLDGCGWNVEIILYDYLVEVVVNRFELVFDGCIDYFEIVWVEYDVCWIYIGEVYFVLMCKVYDVVFDRWVWVIMSFCIFEVFL